MSTRKPGLGKGLGALIGDLAEDFPVEKPVKKSVSLEEELLGNAATPQKKGTSRASTAKSTPKKGTSGASTAKSIGKTATKPTSVQSIAPKTSAPRGVKGTTASGTIVEMIPLSLIKRDPNQPRQTFDQTALEELSASIQVRGVIQPILAEKVAGAYKIVAGERRYRAAKMAGLSSVPVIVKKLTEAERYEIAIIENVQREDLNAMEEARAYKALLTKSGMSQIELATQIGKNRSTIANSMRLLQLPEDMQVALEHGNISAGHARAILSIMNPADQRMLFKKIMQKGLSVREAEAMASALNDGSRAATGTRVKTQKNLDPMLSDMEQRMVQRLGTRVSLKGNLKKGKIEISYYNADDLDRIYNLFLQENSEEYHIQ